MRAARPGDFLAFYGRSLPYTARAWVAELDGEVVGVAGWYRLPDGAALVFSDMAEAMRAYPVEIMRLARAFMARLALTGLPAVCVANRDEKNAARFLTRLGWRHLRDSDEGGIYIHG